MPSSPSREFIYGNGELLAQVSGGATTYYQKDNLSVRMTTDSSGNVLGQQGSFPWGEQWCSSNGSSEWVFTTYQQDQETGLEYAMARYYDPRNGAFCSADPVEGDPSDAESFNRYAYARNNPVLLTDPSGQSWISWLVDAFVAIVAIATNQPELLQIIGALGSVAAIPIPNGGPFPGSTPPTFPGSQPTVTWEQLAIPGYNNVGPGVATFPSTGSTGGGQNLPPGEPGRFQKPFEQGIQTAKKDLKKKKCNKFFGGKGLATLGLTAYRFLNLHNPAVGASTNPGNSVFINSGGPYMTYAPTPGKAGPFDVFWTRPQFRAFIILHELGHELSSITGFQPDANNVSLNSQQSMEVIRNCIR